MSRAEMVEMPDRPPGGHYSQAGIVGDLVFTAGQIATDGSGGIVGHGVYEQTRATLEGLERVLREAGSSLPQVLKTTCFLVDIADFAEFDRAYAEVFGDHRPARSTVAVASLVKGALVEIECVALRGTER